MTDKQDLKTRIKEAIEACATGDLSERALHLLKTLGYHAPRLNYFTEHSYTEFEGNFASNTGRFSKKNALSEHWKSVDVLFQLTGDDLGAQHGIFRNEQVDNTIIQSYLFFALELKPRAKAYTRTELSQITREVNKCFAMPAMILFKHGLSLSFAVIDRRLHKRESSKDVLEKVTLIKDIRTTAPHRAHIEILFDLSLEQLRKKHDVPNFPKLHEAWRKTLDTKELNKRFFRELSNWYFHAVEVTQWPADAEPDADKRNAINTIRLITRLMFVWFLREKDLVPDALFDPRELKKILRPGAKEPSAYYKAILQNLFFATLNTEMGKRRFLAKPDSSQSPHHFIHNVFRYEHCFTDPKRTLKELFDPIPFLNGGLFECLDKQVENKGKLVPVRIDGFSNNPKNPLLVPDKLFFDPEGEEYDFSEVYGTTRARKEKVRGLIDILSSYKFTITENTPIEEEVALDPELLGKVFENLLANYNPETKTTARKQTGSFYTPREIVNYMVDESLIAYLRSSLEAPVPATHGVAPQNDTEAKLRHLLSYTEEPHQFSKAESEKLIAAIDTCKILDPACGSGAFPMGVLHKLVHVLHKLDPQNRQWKERQVEKAETIEERASRAAAIERLERAFELNELDYSRKLYLIEYCIHGVDIQPIAMQIAKLRFFISLIVDQRSHAYDLSKSLLDNRGVEPLPNLETKFVAANTLMKLVREEDNLFTHPDIPGIKTALRKERHRYFGARSSETKAKSGSETLRLQKQLASLLVDEHNLQPKDAKVLANWDPFDQNASAPFFDPEWMYGLSEGFDIVIGNPPYLGESGNKALFRATKEGGLGRFYQGKMDYFYFFIHLALDVLAARGEVAFITTNYYFTATGAKKLRTDIKERSRVRRLVDLNELRVFESALGQHNAIVHLTRGPFSDSVKTCSTRRQSIANHDVLLEILSWSDPETDYYQVSQEELFDGPENYIRIARSRSEGPDQALAIHDILDRLSTSSTKLGEIARINQGVVSGADYVSSRNSDKLAGRSTWSMGDGIFVLDTAHESDSVVIQSFTATEKKLLKLFYKNSDITRYSSSKQTTKRLLYLGRETSSLKNYPNVLKHLSRFKGVLSQRREVQNGVIQFFQLQWPREPAIFEGPKIVVPYRSEQAAFAFNDEQWYCRSDCYVITEGNEEYSLPFILAILNSRVGFAWLYHKGKRKGSMLELFQVPLSEVPIAKPSVKVKAQLEKLVEKRLGLTSVATDARQRAEAERIEREIDQVVYALYGLTAEEVAIVEGSVGAARGKGKGGKKKGAAEAAEE